MKKGIKHVGLKSCLEKYSESQWENLFAEIVKNIDLFSEKLGGGGGDARG